MSQTPTYPFRRGQFLCKKCNTLFFAEASVIEYEDDHFWATCACGSDGLETPQMRNLHGTIGSAKGANMSKEAREKTRLNGFTTGSALMSKYHKGKIPMAPAKPDKYAECDECHDKEACEDAVEDARGTGRPVYCHRKNDVTMKYMAAFLADDPDKFRFIAAQNAANMQQVLNNSFKQIFERGEQLIERVLHFGADGKPLKDEHGNTYVTENISAHPLIKQCLNIMQGMGFSLTDWTMTPKSKEAKDQVAGFLAAASMGSGETPDEAVNKLTAAVDSFAVSLKKAKELRDQDETLKAFEVEQGQREEDDE